MSGGRALWLTGAAAVASGLVAGVFFAFSTFVMPALRRLPARQGIAAMQSINVTVITPLFMLALFGTAVVCGVLAVISLLHWSEAPARLVFAGAITYVLGTTLVTMAYHVPRNDALDRVDPNAGDAPAKWSTFFAEWTHMNHVRTISALAACICFVIALRIE
jgi:uncharacterized membrane protein